MPNTQSEAYLISCNRVVAKILTSAQDGDIVSYGFRLINGRLLEVGRATVSRATKWGLHRPLNEGEVYVNYGGGRPI